MDLHRIHLGCGNFGGVGSSPNLLGRGEDEISAIALLNKAKEIGITAFDTANSYGAGASETILGKWIKAQGNAYRESIHINTKVGNPIGRTHERGLSRAQIFKQIECSIACLQTSYVDTYYFHEPDPRTDLLESLIAMDALIEQKLIRSIGLSNVSLEYLENAVYLTKKHGLRPIGYVQNSFNFLDHSDLHDIIPFSKRNAIKYVAYGPLAGGMLSGKYTFQKPPPRGSRIDLRPAPYSDLLTKKSFLQIDHFIESAVANRVTPQAYALDFIFKSNVDLIIIGPRKEEHFASLGIR